MAGCGMGAVDHSTSGTLAIHGLVHGGQQPVANAEIKLYKVATGTDLSVPMLSRAVMTGADGSFDLSGAYTCGSNDDQVYLVAVGGNPGLSPAVDNAALVLMSAVGSCGTLATLNYLEINEVTTVAAAWALSPFITSYQQIDSTNGNTKGIASAFLNGHLLVDPGTGMAPTLPSNLAIETDKLYALADAIAPCVNSNGLDGCEKLFSAATPPGGTEPGNTLDAALNIVRSPGYHVADVFAALNSEPPFATKLKQAPNDWTMSLTVSGEGMNSVTALAVDEFNNVWVGSYPGLLSAFNAQGTPLSTAGYGSGTLGEVYGLTVDFNNNIWVGNELTPHHAPTSGSVTAFLGAESPSMGNFLTGIPYIDDPSMYFPFALASDPDGDILIANYANSSTTIYNNQGNLVESGVGAGEGSGPVAIAADLDHGIWLANEGDNSATHLSSTGTLIAHVAGCEGANGVATDKYGHAWISNYLADSVIELDGVGNVLATVTGGGMDGSAPAGIAVDASQNVWVANYYGNNFTEIGGNGVSSAATVISPSYGYGLDANLSQPYTVAPDAGGNLWVSNFGSSTLTMFFGLVTPTKTPLLPAPVAP